MDDQCHLCTVYLTARDRPPVCLLCHAEARLAANGDADEALTQSLRANAVLRPWSHLFRVPRHAPWSTRLLLQNILRLSTLRPTAADTAWQHCHRLIHRLRTERHALVTARRRCVLALQRAATMPDDLVRAVVMDWVDVLFCHPWQAEPPWTWDTHDRSPTASVCTVC